MIVNVRGVPRGAVSAAAASQSGRSRFLLAGAAAAVGASVWATQHQQRATTLGCFNKAKAAKRKLKVSWLAVDALSGAIGEIASLVVLYPLDSLKVLCQARGSSTAAVLAELRGLGCNVRVLRQLYAGCGSAALCSAAIGAIYLLAFYSAKRVGTAMAARSAAQQQQQQAAAAGSSNINRISSSIGSQLADGSAAHPPLSCEGTHPLVASLAGVVASLAGSVFEAPMEMFKLRTQAGALDGPMLSMMVREASTRGLGSLYATYGAFMLKSVPYDVAELATYSQLCDWREAAAAGSSSAAQQQQQHGWRGRLGAALAAMPNSASDMLIGAVAGAASVLVSMPCDTIKTRMDLHSPLCPPAGGGLLCSTRAFFDTGRQLVAAGGGPGALFVGVAPRLLQTVPSTMVYWAAVEGTRRLMRQHFDVDAPPAAVASSSSSSSAGGAAGSEPAAAPAATSMSSSSSSTSSIDAASASSSTSSSSVQPAAVFAGSSSSGAVGGSISNVGSLRRQPASSPLSRSTGAKSASSPLGFPVLA